MRVGAVKLQEFLSRENKRPSHFASDIERNASTISRILDGTNLPDVETAVLIEIHAGIDVRDWTIESKAKPK